MVTDDSETFRLDNLESRPVPTTRYVSDIYRVHLTCYLRQVYSSTLKLPYDSCAN